MEQRIPGFSAPLAEPAYAERVALPQHRAIDLQRMGRLALGYLARNPVPERDYQCRFTIAPLNCPPHKQEQDHPSGNIDPIAIGDTESRNDVAFGMMRELTGDLVTGAESEEAVHRRLLTYIRSEGPYANLCWHQGYSAGEDSLERWASLWSTGMLLHSECLRYRRGQGDLATARRLFEGVAAAAVRRNGRAYFHAGGAFFDAERVAEGYKGHYPTIMGPLCEYYLASGDQRCYDLLTEVAEGFLHDLTPGMLHRPDGGVDGHNHVQLHAVRGMAQFAYLTGNPRYLRWVKDIYDFYRRWALDTGWLPEIRDLADHSNHSETCLNGDMHEVALWLALAGYGELWDQLDRNLRNYFCPAQLAVTPEVEALYRRANPSRSAQEIQDSLDLLRQFEGGFISALTPNDRLFPVQEGGEHFATVELEGRRVSFDMMGCCPPEGMRAVYYSWKYAVEERPSGIHVHLPLNVDAPAATVRTELPQAGRIAVTAKRAGCYYLRPPAWAPRERVRVLRGGMETEPCWGSVNNEYLRFDGVLPGETVEICYPLLDAWQPATVTPYEQPSQNYRFHWVGNTCVAVEPKGAYLPLYQDEIY